MIAAVVTGPDGEPVAAFDRFAFHGIQLKVVPYHGRPHVLRPGAGNLLSNAAHSSPRERPAPGDPRRGRGRRRGAGHPGGGAAGAVPPLPRAASPGHARAADGSSLRLAICKGIVQAPGGRIGAESEGTGLGALHFTLPAVESASAPAPAPSPRVSRRRVRVLAVDEDPQDLRYVRDVQKRPSERPDQEIESLFRRLQPPQRIWRFSIALPPPLATGMM